MPEARRPGPHGGSHPVRVGYVQKSAVSPGSCGQQPHPHPPVPPRPEAWKPLGTHVTEETRCPAHRNRTRGRVSVPIPGDLLEREEQGDWSVSPRVALRRGSGRGPQGDWEAASPTGQCPGSGWRQRALRLGRGGASWAVAELDFPSWQYGGPAPHPSPAQVPRELDGACEPAGRGPECHLVPSPMASHLSLASRLGR